MLELEVVIEAPAWRTTLPGARSIGRRAALAAFDAGDPGIEEPMEASVVLADDATVRALNRRYRRWDEPTNVLSFANARDSETLVPQPPGEPRPLGDVVVALETVVAEAAAEGKSLADHLSHLVVHGMLHLLGYDHRTDAEAEEMERLEIQILAHLGVPNPHAPVDDRKR